MEKVNERVDRQKSKDKANEYVIRLIDMEKMTKIDEKNLVEPRKGYFNVPVLKEISLNPKHNQLLNSLKRQEIVTALPKIVKVCGKDYLTLVTRLAWPS